MVPQEARTIEELEMQRIERQRTVQFFQHLSSRASAIASDLQEQHTEMFDAAKVMKVLALRNTCPAVQTRTPGLKTHKQERHGWTDIDQCSYKPCKLPQQPLTHLSARVTEAFYQQDGQLLCTT